MLNPFFEEKFPFVYNYFSTLLDFCSNGKRNFPQALIFEGQDTVSQYLFALELARVLNCQKNGETDCSCTNCRWIRSHQHPCVSNVSQIHYKGDDDATKKVISVAQAKKIESDLMFGSDYHRFYIFFSSLKKEYQEDELKEFRELSYSDDINFAIEPLSFKTFHPACPNALLKSVEEPPKNTTFIFLTTSRENILSTIASRCLIFKFEGKRILKERNDLINQIFSKYPKIDYVEALEISSKLQQYLKENYLPIVKVLDMILDYFSEILNSNNQNNGLYLKIKNDIHFVSEAQKQAQSNIQDGIILDTLLLKIARGY